MSNYLEESTRYRTLDAQWHKRVRPEVKLHSICQSDIAYRRLDFPSRKSQHVIKLKTNSLAVCCLVNKEGCMIRVLSIAVKNQTST
jgi:hypothetical protein